MGDLAAGEDTGYLHDGRADKRHYGNDEYAKQNHDLFYYSELSFFTVFNCYKVKTKII